MCVIIMTLVTYTILPSNGPFSWYLPFSKWAASRIGVRRVSFNAYSKDQLKTILAWEPSTYWQSKNQKKVGFEKERLCYIILYLYILEVNIHVGYIVFAF